MLCERMEVQMELKGSKTEANLMAAFAGESQARNKYTFFAEKAKQDGYQQISDLFAETAHNERAHAELWFTKLQGGALKGTPENLAAAAEGERYEWTEMYAEFAETAKEEGFKDIAALFEMVGRIESAHERRFVKLLENIQQGKVFSGTENSVWICLNCGYIYTGKQPPQKCPVCGKPQAYFQLQVVDY